MLLTKHVKWLEVESQVLQGNPLGDPHVRTLPVYLPPGYEDETDRHYPVIWVLAPFTSWGARLFNIQAWDENIIQRLSRLINDDKAQPAILAFPDGFTSLGGSQYVNSSAVGRYEDYVITELVPLVDDTFRTLPDSAHRGVMGYSSGGYGALMLGMRHPDVFSAIVSHAGDMFFETCYWPDIPGAVRGLQQAGGLDGFMGDIEDMNRTQEKGQDWFSTLMLVAMSACYSPNPEAPQGFDLPFNVVTGEIIQEVWAMWQEADPVYAAEKHIEALRDMRCLFFDCGIRDEYNLFLGARLLHQLLDEHDVPHTYEEFEGSHRNINWRYDISLPIITQTVAR